ncbi:MAG: NAD+ synthase, partial [Pseudomonadota bacterium]|nr:NAD+ synthase [Pseudomonadota bacterium]
NFSGQFSGSQKKIIPSNIFSKAPTAELHPNQKDQDILPPYKKLDGILKGFLEEDMGIRQIVSRGYDRKIVKKVWQMLILAEYKRRQSPPGIKVTKRAFGKDRRYPITNHFFDRP